MSEEKQNPEKENQEDVLQESISKTEDVLSKNKKLITNVLTGVVILIALFVFLKKQVWEPKAVEAKNQLWEAQYLFEQDSFALSLDYMESIASEYASTDAGNGANLYKGISEMKLGYFEEALESLKSYDAEGYLMPGIRNGLIADCYSELGAWESAVEYYQKAAKVADSEVLSPEYLKRAAILLEQNQDPSSAKALYDEILEQYFFEGNSKFAQKRKEILTLKYRAQARI